MNVDVNYLAVFVVALIPMVVGMLWYSPALFGNVWMKLVGMKKSDKKMPTGPMVGSFVVSLIQSYVLYHFIKYLGATTWTAGVQASFWIWLGFVATTNLPDYLYTGRSIKIYKISMGFHLVSMLLMGAALAVWR